MFVEPNTPHMLIIPLGILLRLNHCIHWLHSLKWLLHNSFPSKLAVCSLSGTLSPAFSPRPTLPHPLRTLVIPPVLHTEVALSCSPLYTALLPAVLSLASLFLLSQRFSLVVSSVPRAATHFYAGRFSILNVTVIIYLQHVPWLKTNTAKQNPSIIPN